MSRIANSTRTTPDPDLTRSLADGEIVFEADPDKFALDGDDDETMLEIFGWAYHRHQVMSEHLS